MIDISTKLVSSAIGARWSRSIANMPYKAHTRNKGKGYAEREKQREVDAAMKRTL
jgi:hypothetical protein